MGGTIDGRPTSFCCDGYWRSFGSVHSSDCDGFQMTKELIRQWRELMVISPGQGAAYYKNEGWLTVTCDRKMVHKWVVG